MIKLGLDAVEEGGAISILGIQILFFYLYHVLYGAYMREVRRCGYMAFVGSSNLFSGSEGWQRHMGNVVLSEES
jgi:hypothetical protein